MPSFAKRSHSMPFAATLLLAVVALPAQVPNYNGIWQITPPLGNNPLLFFASDRMRIVAQPPAIACEFGAQFGTILWGGQPLQGSLSSPTLATLSMQTPASQCVWSYASSLTFVGPDLISGTLQATDHYNCFYWGTVTQTFTAQRAPIGMYQSFADGCHMSLGPPLLAAALPPSLGAGFSVTLSGVPANLAFLATGFSNTSFAALSLPLDLGPNGMPACALQVSLEIVEMLTGGPTVQATWTFPNTPGLLGSTFFQQAWVLAPGVNVLGAKMSNAMVGVVGA